MTMIMILGMFVVTFIPRMLPMIFVKGLKFPPIIEQWLSYIPYAALGALIFPGVLTVNEEYPWIGLLAACAAFLTAWWSNKILLALIVAVLTVFVLQHYVVV